MAMDEIKKNNKGQFLDNFAGKRICPVQTKSKNLKKNR